MRHKLGACLLFLGAVIGLLNPLAGDTALGADRPNILIAIADDQSYPHTSAYGDPVIKTPAFDRVARSGVLFHNAFTPAPGCSPMHLGTPMSDFQEYPSFSSLYTQKS